MRRDIVRLWLWFVPLLWLAHALGYLVHEYAHSIAAWALGFKANPLALDYGHLSVQNLALLSDIDENVDYRAIFAAGHGYLAAMVAVAGVLLGNGIFCLISRKLYSLAKERNRPAQALFALLFCLMNVGNFLAYVPVRTFATHADMAHVEAGLHISPWWIATILGAPFAAAILHFFARLLPDAHGYLFPDGFISQVMLVLVSAFTVFVFFGSAGLRGYGEASHWISIASSCGLFPLAAILCWPRSREQIHIP